VHSSRLNHENKKFENFIKKNDYKTRFSNLQIFEETNNKDLLTEKFIMWMKKNSQTLKRLHVLGGEPFYQKEFDQLLDFLSTHSNPNLEFSIITNLSINQDKLISYVEKIKLLVSQKKIRRLDIICSIDCWGPEQEYIRYGLDLSSWESNFNYLLEQKWIVLSINQTISALAIKTIPDLLKKLKIWKSKRSVGHYFTELAPGPSYLKPDIFGSHFFAEDFKTILALLDDNTNQEKETKKYMSGIFNKISSNKGNTQEIKDLIIYLDEIDRRRNTNWKTIFPWLEEYQDVV
jgi:organic radical activating enzyme